MRVEIVTLDQSTLIDAAISGDYQAINWRNHPGGDPDGQYVWWRSYDGQPPNPINFARFNDPEIDRLLDEGRTTPDEAERQQIYEDLNRRFAEQLWNLWIYYTPWTVATAPD